MRHLIMILVALLLAAAAAFAHDHERPELDGWYRGLHASGGAWCCDGSEATHLADVDWESHEGHYRVRIEGQWVEVPDSAVINDPNRDGRTLVWPSYVRPLGGEPQITIRCFLPGSGA